MKALSGGWRKEVFLVKKNGQKYLHCRLAKKKISRRKLLTALKLETKIAQSGLVPARQLLKFGQRGKFWLFDLSYCPGQPHWHWSPAEARQVGALLARLHRRQLAHLDVKPANVLWDRQGQLSGLIDFEEARIGRRFLSADLANSASWLKINGGKIKWLLAGYRQAGGQIKRKEFWRLLPIFMKKRIQELTPSQRLNLAREKFKREQEKIKKKIITQRQLDNWRQSLGHQRLVLTVGSYELLHWGHLEFLKKARAEGDILLVAVASDRSERKNKGDFFPLLGEKTRQETLAYFPFVDAVTIIDEGKIANLAAKIKPDVFFVSFRDSRRLNYQKAFPFARQVRRRHHIIPGLSSAAILQQTALNQISHALGYQPQNQPLLAPKQAPAERTLFFSHNLNRLQNRLRRWRREGKTIVLSAGSFDLFHLGHARFLQKARACGDILLVALPDNKSLRQLKGPNRPLVDEIARARLIANLEAVDAVIINRQNGLDQLINQLKPDVFFTVREAWNQISASPEAAAVKANGGIIVRSARQAPFLSSSAILNQAASRLLRQRLRPFLETTTTVLEADFDPHQLRQQLQARKNGLYQQVLAAVGQRQKCVFCDLKEKYIIAERDGVVLTVSLFPYVDGHLLIIPRRHLEHWHELKRREWLAVIALARLGLRRLREKLGQQSFWFLLREGQQAGKSVNHLHFHLFPAFPGFINHQQQAINLNFQTINLSPAALAKRLRRTKP